MKDDDSVTGNQWEMTKKETAEIASIVVEHNSDGVEVRFFNFCTEPRGAENLLKIAEEVTHLFKDVEPYGESPIATRLDKVLNEYCYEFEKRRRIEGLNLIVLTDGEPSPGKDIEK